MCQCEEGGGEKRILFMGPSWLFPSGRWRRPCEVNTDAAYFPELCKPSVALHKVKAKEPNLLYRFTQLSAAIPHIWRLPVSDKEICHSRPVPHGVLCCIFKFRRNMKVDCDKWAGARKRCIVFLKVESVECVFFRRRRVMCCVKHILMKWRSEGGL